MKILVTGWKGTVPSFIPKTVALYLKEKGHEVDGYVWEESWSPDWNMIYGWTWSDSYKDYVHATPTSTKRDWEVRPITYYDLVIHLGAISDTTEKNVSRVMRQNFDFSLWLLNLCQKYNIPMHYASSASVYGQTTHFQEEGDCIPQSPYAWSKYMFDRIVIENKHRFKTPVTGFRYFNVYGEQEHHKGSQASPMYKWSSDLSHSNVLQLFHGSENYKRDFIWVNDVCQIHEKLLTTDYTGVLNIGTGKSVSFKYIAEQIQIRSNCHIEEIEMPNNLKCQYQKNTCADLFELNKLIDHKFTTVEEYFDKYF
jgi:ADP-L-glycero-D-manno-heptose 6-epimerase